MNGQVVRALGNAIEPSLKGAKYGWNGTPISNEKEVFRNTLISSTKLCSAAEFESISFFFKTEWDQETEQAFDMSFTKADFKKVEDAAAAEGLFKMGVLNHIDS